MPQLSFQTPPEHVLRITTPQLERRPWRPFPPSWVLVGLAHNARSWVWTILNKGPELEDWQGLLPCRNGHYGRASDFVVRDRQSISAFVQLAVDNFTAQVPVSTPGRIPVPPPMTRYEWSLLAEWERELLYDQHPTAFIGDDLLL